MTRDEGGSAPDVSRAQDRRPVTWHLVLVTAVATALAFFELGEKPLAGDEATSYFIASRTWPDFWYSLTTSEANASLFYALSRIPAALGSSEFLLRLLPAFCAVVSVPLLYVLLVRLFGRRTALMGSAALAVNAFFVMHAQDMRGYSMSTMFAVLATLLFVSAVDRPTRTLWALYVTAGVAGCYSHFFCALVLMAHLLSLFFLPRAEVAWRWFLSAYAAMGVLCVPLAYFVLTNDNGQIDWILPTTGEIIVKNLYEFAGHGGRWPAVAVGVCVIVAVYRSIELVRSSPRTRESWAAALLMLWLFLPFAFTFAATFVKPIFIARYLLPALPALAGLVGIGLAGMRSRSAYYAGSVVVLALLAAQLPSWYSSTRPDWKDRADTVIENAGSRDATVFYAPTSIRPFGFYAGYYAPRADGAVAPEPIYPPVDWLGYSRTRFEPDLDAIVAAASGYERVWLIKGYSEDEARQREGDDFVAALDAACGRVRGFTGPVRLYENCGR